MDGFRLLNPNVRKYSWFSNFGTARTANKGWRIDYFLINQSLSQKITKCDILDKVNLSDHVPIVLELNFEVEDK